MPKYFGEANPEIPDAILINILSYLNNRVLTLVAPQISKSWQLITKSKEFHENILMAVLKRIHFFYFPKLEIKFEIIHSGYTNTNYKILKDKEYYVLRIPTMKEHILINRDDERQNTIIAYQLGLGAKLMFYENATGIMAVQYIDNTTCLKKEQLTDENILTIISHALKELHTTSREFYGDWRIFTKITTLYNFIIEHCSFYDKKTLENLMSEAEKIKFSFNKLNIQLCPCHNDLSPNNFLLVDTAVKIIDWEFSGNNDSMWDLSFLSTVSELPLKDENFLLFTYFNGKPSEADHCRFLLYKPIAHFWIGLLSLLQIYNCNERLGKKWLIQIAENKFNKAKTLFEQSYELADKLERIYKAEAGSHFTPDTTVLPSLLFTPQKNRILHQASSSSNPPKQTEKKQSSGFE